MLRRLDFMGMTVSVEEACKAGNIKKTAKKAKAKK